MRLLRLARIILVALRYGLDEFLTGHERFRAVRPLARAATFWRDTSAPRAVRLRLALEALGPIFVKFGQMLSTRRDLLPPDIVDELAKLQDRVPPFPTEQVIATLEHAYGKPVDAVFRQFERTPVASASVAQVHFAQLPDRVDGGPGPLVAVKVLRPNITATIAHDIALMYTGAMLVEKLWSDGRRLRPREVIAAAAQFPALDVPARTRGVLGFLHRRRDGDGAHGGNSDRPRRSARRSGRRSEAAVSRRRRALLHAGIPRCVLSRRHASGQHLHRGGRGEFRQVHRARLRHRRIAVADRPGLPRAELPRVLPPRLPPRCDHAPRVRVGAGGHARRRAGSGDSCGLRAGVRSAAEGDLARQSADPAFQGIAAFQRRDPAAARAAAEDAVQHRGARPDARSGPRPVGDGEAVPRALDARADRATGVSAAADRRSAVHRQRAARAAAAAAPAAARAAGAVRFRA